VKHIYFKLKFLFVDIFDMADHTSDEGPTVTFVKGKDNKFKIITYIPGHEESEYAGRGEKTS